MEALIRFIKDHVRSAGASGVVIGISGGLDSAVVADLCVRALGADAVHGFLMPSEDSNPQDAADGRLLLEHLGLPVHERPIEPVLAGMETVLGRFDSPQQRGNVKARARMMILYAEAQARGCLVAGTGNKSELLIGYFTKHGDGGNDLLPIGDIYKSDLFDLARELGLPAQLIEKPPSAGLWEGQTDEGELGMTYPQLDAILKGIELNSNPDDIASRTGQSLSEVNRICGLVRSSEHKRKLALIPKMGARTVGIDWRRSVHWD
ncbi:MAG: NAD+ synthase [Thermoplasmatota archaeon]